MHVNFHTYGNKTAHVWKHHLRCVKISLQACAGLAGDLRRFNRRRAQILLHTGACLATFWQIPACAGMTQDKTGEVVPAHFGSSCARNFGRRCATAYSEE